MCWDRNSMANYSKCYGYNINLQRVYCSYKRIEYLDHECGYLFGMYYDWCKSFSTYPRSYDFFHVDYLFSRLKKMCV
ncbi:hypothetical protein AHAS_Ahas01G0162100 [Arachis hypogaea]